jgi:hypothetical protein
VRRWQVSRLALVLVSGSIAAAACTSARIGGPDGQGPGLTFPAHFAEGDDQDGGTERAAGGPAWPDAGRSKQSDLPDPQPLRLDRQWEYELVYDRGKVSVGTVRERRFQRPIVTQRQMGRWAIELWIGAELVERVRFDFPLTAADDPRRGPRPIREPPSFAEGVSTTRTLLVPASPRATRAVLVDRATGELIELPWPPDAPLGPPRATLPGWRRADGGSSDAAAD